MCHGWKFHFGNSLQLRETLGHRHMAMRVGLFIAALFETVKNPNSLNIQRQRTANSSTVQKLAKNAEDRIDTAIGKNKY